MRDDGDHQLLVGSEVLHVDAVPCTPCLIRTPTTARTMMDSLLPEPPTFPSHHILTSLRMQRPVTRGWQHGSRLMPQFGRSTGPSALRHRIRHLQLIHHLIHSHRHHLLHHSLMRGHSGSSQATRATAAPA